MKKTLLLAAALMVVTAAVASAQERGHMTLGWGLCREATGPSAATRNFACNTNTSNHLLVGGVVFQGGNVTGMSAGDFEIDIMTQSLTLPAWWQHGTGQCRGTANLSLLLVDPQVPGPACPNEYWGIIPGGPSGGFSYTPQSQANHAVIRIVAAVDNQATQAVPDNLETLLFLMTIRSGNTTTPQTVCDGCQTPACLTLQRGQFFQTNNDNFELHGIPLLPPVPGRVDQVTWQTIDVGGCTDPTPTHNQTWGSIKAIYR
jgi:hypothetical protein